MSNYHLDFWSKPTGLDVKVLEAQNAGRRFDVSLVQAIARRCAHNFPQVIVCKPFVVSEPFPTLFWLTCPYLGKKCGELESQQQIARLNDVLEKRTSEVLAWHREYIAIRRRLIDPEQEKRLAEHSLALLEAVFARGVGGIDFIKNPSSAKCLHLQTATWLGMGLHPAADWLEEKLSCLECGNADCKKFLV